MLAATLAARPECYRHVSGEPDDALMIIQ